MKNSEITINELEKWILEKKDFLFVDVMNPEYFAEKHITGAINAPVYEVAFLSYFEKLAIPQERVLVLYNQKKDSLATSDARHKLQEAGFQHVYEFLGGLTVWEQAGKDIEKGESVPVAILEDGKYVLDIENSLVRWTGRNNKYAHYGKIDVKSGNILVKNEKIAGGKVVLDMTTIKNEDLTDEAWRTMLEAHLKSIDFFDTKKFGEAAFEIVTAMNSSENSLSYSLQGNLSIKDVTREIEFPAIITPMGQGIINGQAHFDFDRTLWNVRYGSEKFFEKLGMHLVNDVVSLELFLVAKK
jgi:polyisoprenoid-binding protein YceI/rhodanese-related sulfurtransferase